MTDPTAPPVLSPLLTMTEAQYAHDQSSCNGNYMTALHRLLRAHHELDAQRATVARLELAMKRITHCDDCGASWHDDGNNGTTCPYCTVARLTAERDHWRDQFDLLRADLAWTPSEQANELSRLTNTLNDAGAKLARLTQENETLRSKAERP